MPLETKNRYQIDDTAVSNTVDLLSPFAAYLPPDSLYVSEALSPAAGQAVPLVVQEWKRFHLSVFDHGEVFVPALTPIKPARFRGC